MPFPPFPQIPAPGTISDGDDTSAARLRSDVVNAVQLLSQVPVFQGAQTGIPVPFTGDATTNQLTAPGSSYTSGTIVSFTGGSLPAPLTPGTLYTVQNPSGDVFQLNSISLSSNGSGLVQQVQMISNAAWSGVTLDTTVTDEWASHLTTSQPAYSYAMLPGVYLADFTFPVLYDSGSGSLAAGITAQEGTGPAATYGGQRIPMSGTGGIYAQASAAKLLQFPAAGVYAGPGNNWAYGSVYQDTGGNAAALITPTRFPQLTVEWIRGIPAAAATELLPVPDNDAWPDPPDYISATFGNKNIRDTIGFLANRPVMEAYLAGSYSLAAQGSLPATGTTIPLDTAAVDPRGAFNTGTSTWAAPVPGVYEAIAQVPAAAASTSQALAAGLTVTSANYHGGTTTTYWGTAQAAYATAGQVNCAVTRRRFRFNTGDTLQLAGFQADSGSNAAAIPTAIWQARLITIWRAK